MDVKRSLPVNFNVSSQAFSGASAKTSFLFFFRRRPDGPVGRLISPLVVAASSGISAVSSSYSSSSDSYMVGIPFFFCFSTRDASAVRA